MSNIYEIAKSYIGQDISPTQDELGCAEAVNWLFKKATNEEIGGGLSTTQMAISLRNDRRFKKVRLAKAEKGDIIISPTQGKTIGHVGLISDKHKIMSNNSRTFLWDEHLDTFKWRMLYRSLDIFCYRYIGFQEDLKICKQELKDTRSVVNSFIFFIKNKLDKIINKNMNLGASTSKTMSLNKIDGLKILKGLGIAMGGSGLAFILSVLPSIDFGKNELLLLPLLSTLVNVGIKYLADNK